MITKAEALAKLMNDDDKEDAKLLESRIDNALSLYGRYDEVRVSCGGLSRKVRLSVAAKYAANGWIVFYNKHTGHLEFS